MTRGRTQGLVAAGLLAPLLLGGCGDAAPARAGGRDGGRVDPAALVTHQRVTDPKGDVFEQASDIPAAPRRNVDVVSTELRRTRRHLVVTVRYADLPPRVGGGWSLSLELTTSQDRRKRGVLFEDAPLVDNAGHAIRWERHLDLTSYDSEDTYDTNRCPRPTYRVDLAADTLILTVPDGCLGSPRWVRVGYTQAQVQHGLQLSEDNPFAASGWRSGSQRLVVPGPA